MSNPRKPRVTEPNRKQGVIRFEMPEDTLERPLVLRRDQDVVELHPEFAAFCRDWDVHVNACAPYRARTKGKTESGVKYVKHNAIAGRPFASFAALEQHLAEWMREADERVHGTTHERPIERFARDEAAHLRALPARPIPSRHQRLERRVANCFVDVDTVRYSVPHRLVRAPRHRERRDRRIVNAQIAAS